jgi:hypothetical protein
MRARAGKPETGSESITFAWNWRGTPIPVGYELSGPAGAEPILMLPAMSRVRSRPATNCELSPIISDLAAASSPTGQASATRRGHGWTTIVSYAAVFSRS